MIQRILMEYLSLGALPVYDCTPYIPYYVLDFADPLDVYTGVGYWRPVQSHSPRIIVPLNIDADLAECNGRVDDWMALAQELPGEGTLIFSVRTSAPLRDGTHYVLAGLAYTPEQFPQATFLEDTNPAELIRQVLLQRGDHPVVQEILARHAQEVENHNQYWVMADAARAIERKEHHKAYKRAARLLHGCLNPKQRRELRKKQWIHVTGQDGQQYRIEARSHQNVFLLEDGVPVMQYCVVCLEHVPVPDLVLAQKFLLESNIEHFMRLANRWDLRNRGERIREIPLNFAFDNVMAILERPPLVPGVRVNQIPVPDVRHIPPIPMPDVAYFSVAGLDGLQIDDNEPLDVAV